MRFMVTIVGLSLVLALSARGAQESQGGDEKSIVDLASELDGPLPARETTGVVREVDYAKRQATISGYVYDFGPPGLPIKVTLASGSQASFELLEPGMNIQVTYGELGTARIAVVVEEIAGEIEEY